jgi:hypothetical protein
MLQTAEAHMCAAYHRKPCCCPCAACPVGPTDPHTTSLIQSYLACFQEAQEVPVSAVGLDEQPPAIPLKEMEGSAW